MTKRALVRRPGNVDQATQLSRLLDDLVDRHGAYGAAAELGVSYQTLRRARRAGRMSDVLREAVERHVTEGPSRVGSPWWKRIEALESEGRQLAETAARLSDELQRLDGRIDGLQQDLAVQGERQQARAASLGKGLNEVRGLAMKAAARGDAPEPSGESHQLGPNGGAASPAVSAATAGKPPASPGASQSPTMPLTIPPTGPAWGPERPIARPSPRPVWTLQNPHWEENHQAWIAEAEALAMRWTEAKAAEGQGRTRLDRVKERERILEMEAKLIHAYHVSIPPGEWWDDATIGWEYNNRWRGLQEVRRERDWLECKRWLRRLVTLGIWWR